MKFLNIALDGPAGAGKSTIAKKIAERLGILHLDTGAMYRAVALKALQKGVPMNDVSQIVDLLEQTSISISYKNERQILYLDGKDVSDEIRTPIVSHGASDVALIPQVREKLVKLQREIASHNDIIMDGRDIGTYVLPNANVKFFLTASVEERAYRRWVEMSGKGYEQSLEDIRQDIMKRDHNDINRAFAPLKKAEDAILIDTTGTSIQEVIEIMLTFIPIMNR